jgi:hypothetical protein
MTDDEDTKVELSLANIEYDLGRLTEWLGIDDAPRDDARLDDHTREATAATILATMVDFSECYGGTVWAGQHDAPTVAELSYGTKQRIALAVALTDALRAALEWKP